MPTDCRHWGSNPVPWQGVQHSNNSSPISSSHLSSQTRPEFILISKLNTVLITGQVRRLRKHHYTRPTPIRAADVCRRLQPQSSSDVHTATLHLHHQGAEESSATRDSLVDFRYLFSFHYKDTSRSYSCSRRVLLRGLAS